MNSFDKYENLKARMAAEKARAQRHAETIAKESVGCDFRIRISKNQVATGKIVKAEVAGWRNRFSSSIAQFRVTMECGEAKVQKTFIVERLPK